MLRKRAFTLIELLVVIAIIALLLSILLPSMQIVKEKARFLICKSGLKQYGIAGAMYLNENENLFPHPYNWLYNRGNINSAGIGPAACHWHDERMDYELNSDHAGTLWPYLASKELHVCPSFGNIAKLYGSEHAGHSGSMPISPHYSYCMNGYLGKGSYSVVPKSTQVRSAAEKFFFAEENTWTIPSWSIWSLNNNHLIGRTSPYAVSNFDACFATFHNMKGGKRNSGNSNAVFLDGSVNTVDYKETFQRGWPK